MKKGLSKLMLLLLSGILLASCSKKEEEKKEGPSGPNQGTARVLAVPGGIYSKVADLNPLTIETAIIKNELDEVIADGTAFELSAEEAGVTFSLDTIDDFKPTMDITSTAGKVKFRARIPTTAGQYRLRLKVKTSVVTGRFTVNVNPGPVYSLGEIKTTRFDDSPPYNLIKDEHEYWSMLADGVSTAYLSIGPISDAFGNLVDNAKIRLQMSTGDIISENPVGVSDGIAYFRLESTATPEIVNLSVDALDLADNSLLNKTGAIAFTRANLQIQEDGNLGNVYLGQDIQKTFTLRNNGTREVTNVTYSINSPFVFKTGSTCLLINKLRVQESCTLIVGFSAGIRGVYQANLRVLGSPLNVPGHSLEFPVEARAVEPATLLLSRGEIDFGEQKCGELYQEEIVVHNVGDEDALDIVLTNPPPHSGQPQSFFQFILPPKDEPMNPDITQPVNCGTTFLAGRKCRIVVRFNPQALVITQALQGSINASGGYSVPITVRGQSKIGDPFGTIPIELTTPEEQQAGQQFAVDNILLNTATLTDQYAAVKVGPIRDKCNNVVNVTTANLSVSKGTLDATTISTNSGIALATWRSSADINDLGTQVLSVNVRDGLNNIVAQGNRSATFRGIKLSIAGTSALGQVLTKKPRTEFYTITNSGNISARNVDVDLLPPSASWFTQNMMHSGGCEDGILEAGASCTIQVTVNTDNNFNPPSNVGNINASIAVASFERGQNSTSIAITGRSEQPPVLSFSPANYDFGSPPTAAGTPSMGQITLSNAGPATALNLTYQIDSPFQIEPSTTTCGTSLLGGQSCIVGIRMTQTTKAQYSGTLKVLAEFNLPQGYAAQAQLSTQIAANLASGNIPMTFGTNAVTVSTGSPGQFTLINHGLTNGQVVIFSGTTAPGGVVFGQKYYVNTATANTFRISANQSLSSSVNISSVGSQVRYERVSAPADKTTTMNVSIGPIRDAYNNIVNTATPVRVSTNAGKLGGDSDGDGILNLTTNAQGFVTTSIVSAEFSEIRDFTLTAEVFNGTDVIASGTKVGSFTGSNIVFSDENHNFGMVTIPTTAFKVFTVRNIGNVATTSGITFSPDDPSGVHTSTNNCSAPLAPNATCQVTAIFVPQNAQVYPKILQATTTGTGVLTDTLALTGEGGVAANLVTSTNSDFTSAGNSKNLKVGMIPGVPVSGSFQVKNTGNEPFDNSFAVSSNVRNSEFVFSPQLACRTLGYNETCTVNFTFTPTALVSGNINATLLVHAESVSRVTEDVVNLTISPFEIKLTNQSDQLQNTCGAVQLSLQDPETSSPVLAPSNLTYTLSKTGPAGSFFSGSNCTGPITSIQIPSGTSSSNVFYYRGTASGTHTIRARAGTSFEVAGTIQVYAAVTANMNPQYVLGGSQSQVEVSGGVSPYTYEALGSGSVTALGVYTAPTASGAYQVRVTDNRGNTGLANITVVGATVSCTAEIPGSSAAHKNWSIFTMGYGPCILDSCQGTHTAYNNACYQTTMSCTGGELSSIPYATAGSKTFNAGTGSYSSCVVTACSSNRYPNEGTNSCEVKQMLVDINQTLVNKCLISTVNIIRESPMPAYNTQSSCEQNKTIKWFNPASCSGLSGSGACNAEPGCQWFPGTPGSCAAMGEPNTCIMAGVFGHEEIPVVQVQCYTRPGVWNQGPETSGSDPAKFYQSSNGHTYFEATTLSGTKVLYKSDGSTTGTIQLMASPSGVGFKSYTEFNGKVYFGAQSSGTWEVWETDGTVSGTRSVKNFGANITDIRTIATSTHLYVSVVTSGAFTGIYQTTTPATSASYSLVSNSTSVTPYYDSFVATKNILYYKAFNNASVGTELFKITGTTHSIVQDIRAGTASGTGTAPVVILDYETNKVVFGGTNASGTGTYMYYYNGTTLTNVKTAHATANNPNYYVETSNIDTKYNSPSGDLFLKGFSTTSNNFTIYRVSKSNGAVTESGTQTSFGFLGQVGNYVILYNYDASNGIELSYMNHSGSGNPATIPGGNLTAGSGSSSFMSSASLHETNVPQKYSSVVGNKLYVGVNGKLYSVSSTLSVEEVVMPTTFPFNSQGIIVSAGPDRDRLIMIYNDPEDGRELYLLKPE